MAATATTTLLLPLVLLLLLSTSTSARPCKSLFFITSTSYTTLPSDPTRTPRYVTLFITNHHKPNRFFLVPKPFSTRHVGGRIRGGIRGEGDEQRAMFFHDSLSSIESSGYGGVMEKMPMMYGVDRRSGPLLGIESGGYGRVKSSMNEEEQGRVFRQDGDQRSGFWSGLESRGYGRVKSSMRDRSKDIMGVVGALLFGMGCGALSAATMYMVWSLFASNRFEFEESDDEEFDGGDDDLYNPKKIGKGGYMVIPSKVIDDDELKKPVGEDVAKLGA